MFSRRFKAVLVSRASPTCHVCFSPRYHPPRCKKQEPIRPTMAAAPFRVRIPGGQHNLIELAPQSSGLAVKEAVSAAVGLEVGTFSLKSDADGRFSVFHAGLTGDWTTGARVQLEAEEAKTATNKCSSLSFFFLVRPQCFYAQR